VLDFDALALFEVGVVLVLPPCEPLDLLISFHLGNGVSVILGLINLRIRSVMAGFLGPAANQIAFRSSTCEPLDLLILLHLGNGLSVTLDLIRLRNRSVLDGFLGPEANQIASRTSSARAS
jgi:hypothetical protein